LEFVVACRRTPGDSMKRMSFGSIAAAAVAIVVSTPTAALAQALPPTGPILRIEAETHGALIRRIDVDSACRLMVTGSDDKSARLWALPEDGTGQPQLLRVFRVPIGPGNEGKVDAVALSPDGRFAAAAGWDVNASGLDNGVYIFEAATGKLMRRLDKLNNVVFHLTFSRDGRYLAATLAGGLGVRVWDTASWRIVGSDSDYGGEAGYGAVFDAAGRLYTTAWDGFLRRYGPDFKLQAKVKTPGGPRPYEIAIHPKGDRLAVGFDGAGVDVYSTKDLTRLFAANMAGTGQGNFYLAVAWSADGNRLYAGGGNLVEGGGPVRIWDREGLRKERDVLLAQDTVMELMPCHDTIAIGTQDPNFGLISANGEKKVWQESTKPDMRGKRDAHFTVSDDGSQVRFGLGVFSDKPVLFDVVANRLTDQVQPATGLAAADNTSLKVTDWLHNPSPKLDGKPLQLEPHEIARSVAVAPGGDRLVLGTEWSLRVFGRDGKQMWRQPTPEITWGVNVARGRKYVLAAYGDGTIRWHRFSDGAEVLALFVDAKTREWVLWTPGGYYASSVNGDRYVGWQLNKGWDQAGEFVTASRLKKHLYRPDIVKRAFELADAGAAEREANPTGRAADFKLADLANHAPPKFHIVDPSDKIHAARSPVEVRLELTEANDAVTGLDVKVNGRQVTPRDVRDIDPSKQQAEMRSLNIPLEKGENHIQIMARNGVGETVQDLLVYLDREGVLDQRGKLYIVAIGVDNYPKLGSKYSLRYAGADARLMLDSLTKKAGPLHSDVVSKLLVSNGDTPPTKANIEDALAMFRDVRPEDTVILFLASHGVNDGADYLMIPEDAERNDAGRWRPSSVVSWSVLQKALQDAQGSRIMFVDTCHASGAYSPRLVKDAADASIVVFSATDKDTEAQETTQLGHGVFTYAVSQGINGGADFSKKGVVNVLALGAYVADEVKHMTNDEQEPVFSAAGVKNFVVARP
jgi:WD40 repeat protein